MTQISNDINVTNIYIYIYMYLIPSRLCTFIFAERPMSRHVILYNISAGFLPPTKRPIPTIQGIVGCTPTNVPLWEIPIYPYIVSVYGSLSPRIPTFSPYKNPWGPTYVNGVHPSLSLEPTKDGSDSRCFLRLFRG